MSFVPLGLNLDSKFRLDLSLELSMKLFSHSLDQFSMPCTMPYASFPQLKHDFKRFQSISFLCTPLANALPFEKDAVRVAEPFAKSSSSESLPMRDACFCDLCLSVSLIGKSLDPLTKSPILFHLFRNDDKSNIASPKLSQMGRTLSISKDPGKVG